MKKMFNIYLSGNMSDISLEEAKEWRDFIKKDLEGDIYSGNKRCKVFSPCDYYNYESPYQSEKEIMRYELRKTRQSDLIIVNLTNHKSLGTMAEITSAYEHDIPVIGYNPTGEEIHPWQEEMCDVIWNDIEDLLFYVKKYYLN